MPDATVGLNCAVGYRFDLSVSKRTLAAPGTQAVLSWRGERLRAWFGTLNLGSVDGRLGESEAVL